MSEHRAGALWSSVALVDGGHRIVWAGGSDATTFLHDLLSQNITGLSDGAAARSLLLAPNGRLRAVMTVARVDDRIAMISTQADHIHDDLTRFRIRVEVDLSIDERPVWQLWGPGADAALAAEGWPVSPDAWSAGDLIGVRDPVVADRWFVAGPVGDLGVEVAEPDEARVRRIEVGEAEFGTDVDESTIPNEAFDLGAAVDFQKGCYLGQELVERIDARGRRVKRLTGIVFDAGPIPPAGAAVTAAGAQVGDVTSTAYSPQLGCPIGLGMIRSDVEAGSRVAAKWASGTAQGTVTPPPLLTNS